MRSLITKLMVLPLIVLVWAAPADAGSQADAAPKFAAEDILAFAKQVEHKAAAEGARVIIVARAGRPASEMPEGFRYTHVGFGVYSMITTADGDTIPGYAMYNLYQDDEQPDRSSLVQDYPADFFGGVYQLKTTVLVPAPELQRQLLRVITSDIYPQLHNPEYSVLANPYNARFQNCTEFVLDVIHAAIYKSDDMPYIKANTQAYYKAQEVRINPLKLLLGAMTMPDVRTVDHKGGIRTASFTTIANYLKENGLVKAELDISQ